MHLFLSVTLYAMAGLYMVAGINHFISPGMYLKIMPPYLPWPKVLNFLAGLFEIGFGMALLWPSLRPWAAWGIILLLIAVFPANIYMYQQGHPAIPDWVLLLRLPLQGLLIYWAWLYT